MKFASFTGLETGAVCFINPESVHVVVATDTRTDGSPHNKIGSVIVYGPQAHSLTVKEDSVKVVEILQRAAAQT